MKIYISLPITGRDIKDVEVASRVAADVIAKNGHTPVSPLNVSPDPDATYAQHMGNDIKALLECDAVLLMPGWIASKGCRLESIAAMIYGKRVYTMDETTGAKYTKVF